MTSYLDLAASSSPVPPDCDAADGKLHVQQILRRAYSSHDLSAPGGLVVLAACVSDITPSDYDEALTLSTAFLAAGAVSVVGSRWEISDRVTPVLIFMFHYFLRREGMIAADALQATQEWMLDSGRAVPPEMDPVIRDAFRTHDCTDITAWAAFIHQGR
jgi:CHAT domain-containing protein